jgi:hypothetical protein
VNPTLDSRDTPLGKDIRDDSTSSRFINEVMESCDIVIENKPVTGCYLSAAQKVEYNPESNLSEIHTDHLVQIEAEMRTKLSLEGLLPLLERPAGGFMTPDERIAVTNTSTDPEKVSKIISGGFMTCTK